MKTRKSKSYLIVSSSQLGVDEEIAAVFSQVSKKYKSSVIHLGPTATDKEIKTRDKLLKTLRNLETLNPSTNAQEEKLEEKINSIHAEIRGIDIEYSSRISTLTNAFGKITIVTNDSTSLPIKTKNTEIVKNGMALSKYLFLSALSPRGVKATRNPLNKQAITHLKEHAKNWIMGFPVPSVDCLPKPGLNESYNYWTVGALTDTKTPYKYNELYQSDHLPCAVFVVLDTESGEFHAKQLHIDYLKDKTGKVMCKFVSDDGLVFLKDKVVEVGSSDRASFSTDDHAPFQHPGTIGCFRALNILHKPEVLINGGDAGSFESINHHEEDKPGATEGMRLVDDLRSLRKLMDAQSNVPSIKRRVMVDSNHHEWLTRLTLKMPCLIGMLDWPTLAVEMFSDWEIMLRGPGDNKLFYFGDMLVRHGDKDGGAKKAEGITSNGKYICGHFHRFGSYRRAIQLGCGASLGPAYTGNQVNAWQSQIASFTKFNGVTSASPKIVLHDKIKDVSRFSYRNEIYEVSHYYIK